MPPFPAWAWLYSEAPRQFAGCDGVRSRDFFPRQAGAFAPTCRQPRGMASGRRDGLETAPTRGLTGNAMAIHCQPRSHRTWHSKIGPVSRIRAIDGVTVTYFDGTSASASRSLSRGREARKRKSDAPSLVKRCAARSDHQGPVLAVLAMLAAKRRLRVAPRGCALPLTAVACGAL